MEAKHTATPWLVGQLATDTPENPGSELRARIIDARGAPVATMALRGYAAYDNANAAFIVRACNAHDDLVKALEYMLNTCGHLEKEYSGDYDFSNERAVLAAALSKADI